MGVNRMQSEMQIGDLCEELVGEILDRISIKHVTRMKCLSSSWQSLILRYRKSRPRTSSSMFFCQYPFRNHENLHQIIILNAREQQGGKGESLCLHKAIDFSTDTNINFMGSSGGLLLFSQYICPCKIIPYVCNPRQKQWQWDTLPTLFNKKSSERAFEICMGLAFDGVSYHPYKVICYTGLRREGNMEFEIYSSDTGEWRKDIQRVHHFPPQQDSFRFVQLQFATPHLFLEGNMICIISRAGLSEEHMLVYSIKNNLFKLMRLPNKDVCFSNGFIWISEGVLHYCRRYKHGFHVWKYAGNIIEDMEVGDDEYYLAEWRLKHTAEMVNLITQHPEIYGPIEERVLHMNDFEPCAFDEDLQIMYIQLPTTILSYSFETQRLERVWSFEPLDTCWWETYSRRSLSIQFNGAVHPGNDSILSIPEALPAEGYIIY